MFPFGKSMTLRLGCWLSAFSALAVFALGVAMLEYVKELINPTVPVVTETFTLPSGEILTNVSQTYDDYSTRQLYYQPNASSPRESLGRIDQEDPAISLRRSKPLIFKDGSRVALVIGSYVFERWERKGGPYWGWTTTKPDSMGGAFLRTFLKPGDPRIPSLPHYSGEPGGSFENLDVNYVFDHLDLAQNLLVTQRELPGDTDPMSRAERAAQRRADRKSPNNIFPKFLVYSAPQYGYPLTFDLERTRTANGLPPPDAHLLIDVSVVILSGDENSTKALPTITREIALDQPGAKEVFAESLPLNGQTWTRIDYSIAFRSGLKETSHFEAIFDFVDPAPSFIAISWQRVPGQIRRFYLTKTGFWEIADESGFADGTIRIVYFRVQGL